MGACSLARMQASERTLVVMFPPTPTSRILSLGLFMLNLGPLDPLVSQLQLEVNTPSNSGPHQDRNGVCSSFGICRLHVLSVDMHSPI